MFFNLFFLKEGIILHTPSNYKFMIYQLHLNSQKKEQKVARGFNILDFKSL